MGKGYFEFYGQDWLMNPKIISLSVEDRLCFITLLCLASASDEYGMIKSIDEESLLKMTHLSNDPFYTNEYGVENEWDRAQGCLRRFIDNELITADKIDDNNLRYHHVVVVDFLKKRGSAMTPYERIKKFRAKEKTADKKELEKVPSKEKETKSLI